MRNLSRFIPGEEIAAVSQWNFSAVDTQSLLLAAQAMAQQQATERALALARDEERDEVVRQQAYAEGFAQGKASVLLQAEKQVQDYKEQQGAKSARQFGQLFDCAHEQLAQSQVVMAQGVLDLACALARQVLRHELSVNPNALQPVVREGLAMLSDDNKAAALRLNPIDLDVLQETMDAEFANVALTWIPDASIEQGGCVISAGAAVVDGELPTRWRRAVAKLGLEVQWDD